MSIMKVFGDPISPVCRSVMLFLAANDIQHEFVLIDVMNSESHVVHSNHALSSLIDFCVSVCFFQGTL